MIHKIIASILCVVGISYNTSLIGMDRVNNDVELSTLFTQLTLTTGDDQATIPLFMYKRFANKYSALLDATITAVGVTKKTTWNEIMRIIEFRDASCNVSLKRVLSTIMASDEFPINTIEAIEVLSLLYDRYLTEKEALEEVIPFKQYVMNILYEEEIKFIRHFMHNAIQQGNGLIYSLFFKQLAPFHPTLSKGILDTIQDFAPQLHTDSDLSQRQCPLSMPYNRFFHRRSFRSFSYNHKNISVKALSGITRQQERIMRREQKTITLRTKRRQLLITQKRNREAINAFFNERVIS